MKKTYQKPEMKILPEIWKVYKDTRIIKTTNRKTKGSIWEVSNYGNVKKDGEIYECTISGGGYKYFSIYPLHRAVAELFIPNPENKPHIDHLDTNKLNNKIDNLQWCTPKENCNNPLSRLHKSIALKNNPKVDHRGEKNPMYGRRKIKIKI